jgi:predicted aspartyl protease
MDQSAEEDMKAMGTFSTKCSVESVADRKRFATVPGMLVDTDSEYTWFPAKTLESIGVSRAKKDITFPMASGQHITRSVGFAVVRAGEFFTVDEVVFADKGDLALLGARSLEGFNARVDSQQKELVAAGSVPAVPCDVR